MNLKKLVNDKDLWLDFSKFLDDRINSHYESLRKLTEPHEIYREQGEISALKRMKRLREEVNNG